MPMFLKSTDKNDQKSYLFRMTAILVGLFAASIALGFVYSSVSNNIVYMYSALMYVLEIGLELLDLAVYAVAFSFFVFATERYGFRMATPFFASYAILVAARRLLSLVLELLLAGAVGADDFVSVAVYFALDMLTCSVVLAIIAYDLGKYSTHIAEWKKAQRTLGEEPNPPSLCPFEKIFSRTNPLQLCALKIGILLSSAKIISRIIFDLYYGAPGGIAELLIMIAYYLSDILIGVLVYAAMFWIFGLLYREKTAKETEA